MKIGPIDGSKVSRQPANHILADLQLYTASYDCSLRAISFSDCVSRELFSMPDEDMLITHFDLAPDGNQAWIADKNGGISHADFREGKLGGRRRWVVSGERAAKLGGLSINRKSFQAECGSS